jgi:serine/threonine protein kinase
MSARGDLIAGRYRLVDLVGTGGMGSVWEAYDERLRRPVAVKQLHRPIGVPQAEADLANQRAMREARITARLHHRHAVAVFDVVEHQGQLCLIMQFLPSIPLSTVLRDTGPLLPHEAAKVGAQVSSALAAAHAAGIVHRDVKPGNILIADDGNALISDFGISHALGDATLTATGMVHGTPAFLAPEVARGEDSSAASDVFSLGSTLYAALEGKPPFGLDPNTIALLHRVASGVFPPPQRAGPLTRILLDMLAVDSGARPTMAEVATTLADLAAATVPVVAPIKPAAPEPAPPPDGTTPTRVEPESPPPPPVVATPTRVEPEPAPIPSEAVARRRSPALGVLAALVILALIAAGAWWLSQRPDPVVADQPPATTTSAPPATSAPSASPSPSASEPASTEPTPSAATPSRSPTKRTTSAKPTRDTDSPPTARQLAEAITSYYALMPDQTDEAWRRLTPSYRRYPAGGRQGFERFWNAVERVSARDATGDPPDRAEATIVYVFKDGRVVTERTAYGLVNDDGVLKINTSQVLSSSG